MITKRIRIIVCVFLFTLVLGMNLYIRAFPAWFPEFKKTAAREVKNEIRKEAIQKVEKAYPNFNPLIKKKLTNEVVNQQTGTPDFQKRVEEKYKELKDPYQDSTGTTYLLGLDPFHWMRYTKLVLQNGFPGDIKKDDEVRDTLMYATVGVEVTSHRFLFYSTARLYRIYNAFFPDVTIEQFCFYIPLFQTALLLIILFLVCWRFFSIEAGVLAALICGLAPSTLQRSMAGWYDMDILSLLLPLVTIWLLAEAPYKGTKNSILCSIAASFFLALFAYTWPGWFFIYIVCLVYIMCMIANSISLHWKDRDVLYKNLKPYIVSFSVFLAGCFVFCLAIFHIPLFSYLVNAIKQNIGLGKALHQSIWPKAFYTVAELQPGSYKQIITDLHGGVLFFCAILATLWIYYRERRSNKVDICLMLLFWFLFMGYSSLKGVRFCFFLTVPYAIFLSAASVEITKIVLKKLASSNKIFIKYVVPAVLLLCIGLALHPVVFTRGEIVATNARPFLTDKWYNALKKMDREIPQNALLNSWWDFGDWFKEVAQRKVIFDGQSQSTPISYWMGKTLLSTDEQRAVTILRMLNNSSYTLFGTITKCIPDHYEAIALLERLIAGTKEDAQKILRNRSIPHDVQSKVLKSLFDAPRAPAYLIIEESMIGKLYSISFLGNWSFPKVYIMNNSHRSKGEVIRDVMRLFDLTAQEAGLLNMETTLASAKDEVNDVLSRREVCRPVIFGREDNGRVCFDNGLVYYEEEGTAKLPDTGHGYRDVNLFYVYDGIEMKKFDSNDELVIQKDSVDSKVPDKRLDNLNVTEKERNRSKETGSSEVYFLFKEKNTHSWKAVSVTSPEVIESVLFRLFFMNGCGLDHFELSHEDKEAHIYIYRILWDKQES